MAVIESDKQEISPRGVQIEALYELEKFRDNGEKRGLVVAATGVGKTYLAAFDAKNFNRILFVAHREEIIKQAEKSFKKVCPNKTSGFFYSEEKTQDADMIFALVNTIGKKENLELFDREYFDYIVIDEFHHAAADSYKNLLEYFKPKFLLGLTATPARMDNRDILKFCDYNIPYEINLKSAINRVILVPFRYCGIYDATDYSEIKIVNGKYNENQLGQALSNGNRADLILKNYQKYELSPALGFCSNIEHCDYMAEYFNEHGIKSCSVHSGNSNNKYCMKRDEAIQKLKSGEIKVLFSVDIFNEGVDIPEIRLVMFLRPTESYNVFMQQLGRGLRKFEGKNYLIVLDFIGNYLKANYKPHLLTGILPHSQNFKKALPEEEELPDDCIMDYDFRIIDLFKEMNKREPLELRLKINYCDIKKKLGRRPTREDMFEESDIPLKTYTNKYKSWLKWLEIVEDLRTEEKEWIDTEVEEFLESLEKTSMSKSYKIPTILAFFRGKYICNKVTLEEVAATHMDFYLNSTSNMQDLCDERHKNILAWTINDYMKNAKNNPIKYLTNSNKFFNYEETTNTFYLNLDIDKINQSLLYEHVMDILRFRKKDYFSKRYGE